MTGSAPTTPWPPSDSHRAPIADHAGHRATTIPHTPGAAVDPLATIVNANADPPTTTTAGPRRPLSAARTQRKTETSGMVAMT
jgi:hypothetical protein